MRRLRLWRIRRAYTLVARLEPKVPDMEMAELRQEFAAESFAMVDRTMAARGYSRQRRRATQRAMARHSHLSYTQHQKTQKAR